MLGRHDEAQVALQRALEILAKHTAADSPLLARVQRSLGELAMARNDLPAAITHFQRSLDVFAMVRDPEDGEMAVARIALARALAARPGIAASERAEATATVTAALAVLERKGAGWARERFDREVEQMVQQLNAGRAATARAAESVAREIAGK